MVGLCSRKGRCPMQEMTMRQRMLAAIEGRPADRVPFVQYDGLAAPSEEIWSVIGRNNMGLIRWSGVHRCEHPNCRIDSEEIHRDGRRGIHNTLYTPEGNLFEERFYEPAYGSTAAAVHYVKEPGDYRALMALMRDTEVHVDTSVFDQQVRELGEDGLPMVAVERTPFQQLWIQWVCLEDFCLHMADEPGLMEEVLSLLVARQRKVFAAVRRAADRVDIPYVDFPDNVTAPVIGEVNFRKYNVPLYNELADMLADKGIPVFVHMDGDLKPLWRAIGESKIRGLDSLSPQPDNDTGVGQAAAMWPRMRLFLNFPSSVHLARAEVIYNHARRMLQEAGHTGRMQIQISENVPSGEWRKSFPQIVRAIEEFGPPGD